MRILVVLLLVLLVLSGVWWLARDVERDEAVASVPAIAQVEPAADAEMETVERGASTEGQRAPLAEAPGPETDRVPPPAPDTFPLEGILVHEESGQPLPGVPLGFRPLFGGGPPRAVVTDERGHFAVQLPKREHILVHDPPLGEAQWLLDPSRFEVPRPAEEEAEDLVIRARQPPYVLDAYVVYEDGRPADGAVVLFQARHEELTGLSPQARADEEGRTAIGIWDPETFTEGHVRAWDAHGNVSEILPVAAPFVPFVRHLVLGPGGEVDVVVRREDRAPVGSCTVAAIGATTFIPGVSAQSADDGRCTLPGLYPGMYRLRASHPDHGSQSTPPFEVRRGERVHRELILERNRREELAVEGRVLDEEGRPLAGVELVITAGALEPAVERTDAEGRFRLRAAPCDGVLVRANLSSEGDRFTPEEAFVAFGTRGVEFRREMAAREARFDVEVVDALTGEELSFFTARIDRGPGSEEWSNAYAPRRTFALTFLPETRWRIAAPGHLVRSLDLAAEVARLEENERLRVELQRGLHHSMRVVDSDTGTPVPHIRFRSATGEEAVADQEGIVTIDSDHWSIWETVHPDYEPQTWDPEDFVLWDWGPMRLTRRGD